jgi:hypothetical protein
LFAIALLFFSLPALAQTGGQVCVRGFEDRNANGILDGGEPLLTSGLSADLLNAGQIVVASALLDDSPTAAQGVICFQLLTPGQYSLVVTAAGYRATTPSTLTASITDGTLPTVMEFGARRLDAEATAQAPAAAPVSERDTLARIVLSLLGALVVMAATVVLGALVYMIVVRPRPRRMTPVPAAGLPDFDMADTPSTPMSALKDIPPVDSEADTDEIKPI